MHSRERAPVPRRGFLTGLASLPLIGGSIALVGRPTGVAAETTQAEAFAYCEWLHMEAKLSSIELFPELGSDAPNFHPCGTGVGDFHFPSWTDRRQVPRPSTRAALVLAAVGYNWRRGAR